MREHKPIIIAGFGRSGTTWLSDIISKALGGIILFEPYHPSVYTAARETTYSLHIDKGSIAQQWTSLSDGSIRDRWLLRNHLRTPIESISQAYIDEIWRHTQVIGMKVIRLNHTLSMLSELMGAMVIYIVRHPLAVISSIEGRGRFWLEFGWDWHWEHFLKRSTSDLDASTREQLAVLVETLSTRREQIAYMWALSQRIAIPQVIQSNGLIISYEALYDRPYEETRRMLDTLGEGQRGIHPSYIFEPSMTTLRTFHNSEDKAITSYKAPEVFWKNRISAEEAKSLMKVVIAVMEITKFKHESLDAYLA